MDRKIHLQLETDVNMRIFIVCTMRLQTQENLKKNFIKCLNYNCSVSKKLVYFGELVRTNGPDLRTKKNYGAVDCDRVVFPKS